MLQRAAPPHRQHDTPEALLDRRTARTAGLLRIYHYYRVVICGSLLAAYLGGFGEGLLGSLRPNPFILVTSAYTAVNIVLALVAFVARSRWVTSHAATYALVVADILVLTLLVHFSAGVASGLGSLLIVSVGAGTILFTGRLLYSVPAVATIAILYEEFYLSLIATDGLSADFFQAGMLGALYFGTALFVGGLAARLRFTELQSDQNAREVLELEHLSEQVIQRMRTGIVVVTADRTVRMINESARRLLGLSPRQEPVLPAVVLEQLNRWDRNQSFRAEPFQPANAGPVVRANFSVVSQRPKPDTIVFLEDHSELQQQAQQLKLAALGRLSASIAHEIRNPLGAISHAAQLLAESPNLDKADARLAEIIQSHSQRMNTIIENVLELSRRRDPQPRQLVLADWIDEFLADYRESKGEPVEIDVELSPPDAVVRMDPNHLRQVLTNLADNGLRYSARQTGNAVLHLRGGIDPISDRPYLDVVDNGAGVPATKIADLFEPFFTTESEGTGLGLHLSRELCEANQSRLSYLPAETGGACFRITFAHPHRLTASVV